ncbi:MAG: hypothetical protein HJJLKODD_00508 [Phycisphaerae bacterium]|nr:hypothetical protein [Phycisphaerae bacterium]
MTPASESVAEKPRTGHVLGPLLIRTGLPGGWKSRLPVVFWLLGGLTILGVAGYLNPRPEGLGTHEQLGLPPCSMVIYWGIPCPTCGMTTAFAYTVRGQWVSAFMAQPCGWLLCVAVMMGVVLAMLALFTGVYWRINWYRLAPLRVALVVIVLLLGAWGFRIVVYLARG